MLFSGGVNSRSRWNQMVNTLEITRTTLPSFGLYLTYYTKFQLQYYECKNISYIPGILLVEIQIYA